MKCFFEVESVALDFGALLMKNNVKFRVEPIRALFLQDPSRIAAAVPSLVDGVLVLRAEMTEGFLLTTLDEEDDLMAGHELGAYMMNKGAA